MLRFEERFRRTGNSRPFEEDFFDFSDPLRPWTTVYRFMLFFDLKNDLQAMVGFGLKGSGRHRVNGVPVTFNGNMSRIKVPFSCWYYNNEMVHRTGQVTLETDDGAIESEGFSFTRERKGYRLKVDDLKADVSMKMGGESDYVRFNLGYIPFSRHNCYLPYRGEFLGHKSEGVAFVQKVNHNMPFIPWRWGRAFFEDGSNLVFFEPRIGSARLFRSLRFVHDGKEYDFSMDTRLEMEKGDDGLPRWNLSGRTKDGESIRVEAEGLARVENIFESGRSTFSYNEFPSRLRSLEFMGPEGTMSMDDLGSSSINTEDAYYVKVL